MRRLLLATLVLVLALPAVASAHSIIRVRGSDVSYTSSDATSLNQLVIRASSTEIEFRDPTVDGGIDYGTCRPGETNAKGEIIQAFCTRNGLGLVRIDLGEREDSLEMTVDLNAQAIGGGGADRVTTAAGNDVIVGGDGNDDLRSNAGNDNVLAGAGDDTVAGGDGNDQIQGGAGIDSVGGDAGNDDIRIRDGARDVVVCGDGDDAVDADSLDEVAADCERVTRHETAAPPQEPGQPAQPGAPPARQAAAADDQGPVVRAGALTLQRLTRRGSVRIHVTSSEAGTVAASGYVTIGGLRFALETVRAPLALDGGGITLETRLSRATLRRAQRALRARGKRRRSVSVRLGVVATDRAGNSSATRTPVIRLRR